MSDYQPRHDLDPVFYNGVQVNDLTWLSDGGVGCRITGISGWQDNIDVRDVRDSKPGQHGEDASNAYMGGRTITIQGEVDGSTFANLQSRLRTLATTFAPTTSEVVLKMPDPSQASPTTSYAAEISGYERCNCKVVEPITFGEKSGPFNQSWQVVLRASDPRIYSDVTTTDDFTISSYAGTVATPVKLQAVVVNTGGSSEDGAIYKSGSPSTTVAWFDQPSTWYATTSLYTTKPYLTVDSENRNAYMELPHHAARKLLLDPVWYYPMNETSGVTADNMEGTAGYDGTINGTPSLNQTGPATDLPCIVFDGVNDSISRAYSANMWPSDNWTFEGWFNRTAGGSNTVIDATAGGSDGFIVAWSNGSMYVLAKGASNRYVYKSDSVTTGTWYHLAIVYAAGTFTTYINGVKGGSAIFTYTKLSSGTMYIGRDSSGSFWSGKAAGIGMHNVAYSAQTISDMYNSGGARAICRYKSGSVVDPVNEWPTISGATTFVATNGLTATNAVSTFRTARL